MANTHKRAPQHATAGCAPSPYSAGPGWAARRARMDSTSGTEYEWKRRVFVSTHANSMLLEVTASSMTALRVFAARSSTSAFVIDYGGVEEPKQAQRRSFVQCG